MADCHSLGDLVHCDVWLQVLNNLKVKEIALTRRVCRDWYSVGKQWITLYQIGLDQNGWSQWNNDKSKTYGWGMLISVDYRGIVRGMNKNNSDHAVTARLKEYSGKCRDKQFDLQVIFPQTGQENNYKGTFVEREDKKYFTGTFLLLKSCGHRSVGDGGIVEGLVLEV